MKSDRALFLQLLRSSFHFFTVYAFGLLYKGDKLIHYPHLDALFYELENVMRGRTRRLILTMPPRSLKSTLVSVIFVAWWLLHKPHGRIICVSYSEILAKSFARDCRRLLEDPTIREAFPAFAIDPRKNTETEIVTTANGCRFTTSVGGTTTGKGADLIVVDDPMSATDVFSETVRQRVGDWFDGTLVSRLNNQRTGRTVIVGQRLHADDLIGRLLARKGWHHVSFPIRNVGGPRQVITGPHTSYLWAEDQDLIPDFVDRVEQDRLERDMGSQNFSAQYLQDPLPPGGNIIKLEWLKAYDAPLVPSAYSRTIISWDIANKPGPGRDYSVAVVIGVTSRFDYHLLRVYRMQLEYPDLRRQAEMLIGSWKPSHVLIEDAGNGMGLYQELRQTIGVTVLAIKPQGDKETRAYATTPVFEQGRFLLPEAADWLADYHRELTGFPATAHDDQVDATTQALLWLEEQRRNQPPLVSPFVVLKEGYYDPDERGVW